MRIPVPTNRLVALTLVGALLTAVVAVGLAFPLGDLVHGDDGDVFAGIGTDHGAQAAADTPTPNPNYTPAAQTQSGSGDDDHEEHEEYEEYEDDDHEEE